MKILHVWNTCGVGSLLAKTQRKHGHEVKVLMRGSHDPFMFTEVYGDDCMYVTSNEYIKECIEQSKKHDIIHVHSAYTILEKIREANPNKKIILQHHGTELTTKPFHIVSKSYTYADAIVSSTKDLYQLLHKYGVKSWYIPNAVDTDFFKPLGLDKINQAFIDYRYYNEHTQSFIDKHIDVELYPDTGREYFCNEMPELLNQFELYIDVKCPEFTNYEPVQAMSKTGLEALACGLKVLNYNGNIVEGLPNEHTPEQQYVDILSVYHS